MTPRVRPGPLLLPQKSLLPVVVGCLAEKDGVPGASRGYEMMATLWGIVTDAHLHKEGYVKEERDYKAAAGEEGRRRWRATEP